MSPKQAQYDNHRPIGAAQHARRTFDSAHSPFAGMIFRLVSMERQVVVARTGRLAVSPEGHAFLLIVHGTTLPNNVVNDNGKASERMSSDTIIRMTPAGYVASRSLSLNIAK